MTIVICQILLVPSKTYADFGSWWGLLWVLVGLEENPFPVSSHSQAWISYWLLEISYWLVTLRTGCYFVSIPFGLVYSRVLFCLLASIMFKVMQEMATYFELLNL